MEDGEFEEKSGLIQKLGNLPPDQLATHLANTHPVIQAVAPNMAPHVHSAAINAIQFLNGKLPRGGNELIQDAPTQPSLAQQSQWLNLHSVVNNPLSVLDHVENGTLNQHHIEALQSVYPDLHAEMATKIGEQLGKLKMKGQELPYHKRLQIGMLMGAPLDSTMTPQSMQAIINSQGPQQAQRQAKEQAKKPKPATGVELDQINKVNEMAENPLQRLATKER